MVATRREFLALVASTPIAGFRLADMARGGGRGTAAQAPAAAAQPLGARVPLKLGDDRDGFVYVPNGYAEQSGALPLLVMLHGAGSTALSVQYALPLADEFGFIVLAPDSRDERTWDGVLRSWGPDVEFIGAALQQTISRYSVDRGRLGVGGFSDGASYALSFGISYGNEFTRVIAMSPGVMQP